MHVVIAGAGRIGRAIIEDLVAGRHEVSVIERNRERAEMLVADKPVLVIQGDACDLPYLEQAGVGRADVFVATTHDDDVNLVACQLANIEFGVRRTIARVNAPRNVDIFTSLGIEPVSSTLLISRLIEQEMSVGELVRLLPIKDGRVTLVELRVPDDEDAPPARDVRELDLPPDTILVAILRGDETLIPRGDTRLLPGDDVIAVATPASEQALRDTLMAVR